MARRQGGRHSLHQIPSSHHLSGECPLLTKYACLSAEGVGLKVDRVAESQCLEGFLPCCFWNPGPRFIECCVHPG